jgi:hypothetical protein
MFEALPNGLVMLGHVRAVAEITFAADESAGFEFAVGTRRAFVVIELGTRSVGQSRAFDWPVEMNGTAFGAG